MDDRQVRAATALGFHAAAFAQHGSKLREEPIVILNPMEGGRTEDQIERADKWQGHEVGAYDWHPLTAA
jgi:hypothetical protein